MSSKVSPLHQVITCHAWNKARDRVALCPNTNEIIIYKVSGSDPSTWVKEFTLVKHDQVVTGIDWAPETNRIISCSQDRNAFVWTFTAGQWEPQLVNLRFSRAATMCRWSPNEEKFAVGSGSKQVCVCYYEEENQWWVGKVIKKHRSTVLAVAWHPTNNSLLATACSDYKCRIVSAHIKGIDKGAAPAPFGEVLQEFNVGGWVHDVAWSPSGAKLAFVGHDSSLHVADVATQAVTTVLARDLPFMKVLFLSETALVAAGFDCSPVVHTFNGSVWEAKGKCDGEATTTKAATSSVAAARTMWQSAVTTGSRETEDTELPSSHQNTITDIQPMVSAGGKISKFSTSGIDGRVVVWETAGIERILSGLRI